MAERTPCPCGLGEPYDACCGPLHTGAVPAATAEQLMRSRYSAFAVGDAGYLVRTWHPDTRPARLRLHPGQRWTGLRIVERERGGLLDREGTVEFRATYVHKGQAGEVHERSRFTRVDGAWLYVGEAPAGRPPRH
jgi:SEC-C motif-containing protein